jgi:hypothetical protein
VVWLGDRRGFLTDWLTQQWVRSTGRRVNLADEAWLDGPAGNSRIIGRQFFADYARDRGLEQVADGRRGLMPEFDELRLPGISAAVRDFYESTASYDLDAWAEWRGAFRPFGRALAVLFSRRLQQLNVPLSALDSSKGMTSSVSPFRDARSGKIVHTAWVRELHATGNVLYAGAYSTCCVPGHDKPCVKVVFPLPNGSATVVMRPEAEQDGSLTLTSAGERFGDPGFYFVVQAGGGHAWARYVRCMQESIRVYPGEGDTVRADHVLWLWGMQFLRLHYRMRPQAGGMRFGKDALSARQ